jgi:tripartite-type tricarboxylate transporter receptor subunit TctC
MKIRRRDFLHLAGSTVVLSAVSRIARAETYPTRPIRVIVPFTPGSPVDAAARVLTQQVQLRIGQGVVIENRPGGGTTIGTKAAASALSQKQRRQRSLLRSSLPRCRNGRRFYEPLGSNRCDALIAR